MIKFLCKKIYFLKKLKMQCEYKENLKKFEKLTLTELNSTASFLKRIDRKFLLTKDQFKEILEDLKKDFRVLEINNLRMFKYDNVYMDTKDFLFYKQHQNWINPRTKIRTRLYKDSNLAFFEYKHKQDWVTQKFRYSFPVEEHWTMTKWKKRFFEWVWQSLHNWEKAPEIFPAIRTTYDRITLVSKNWEERLTIDFNIKTKNLRRKNWRIVDLKNLVIIESKTLKEDAIAIKIMEKHNIEKAKACSKYSLGVIYAWLAEKYDHFKETMEKIREIRIQTLKNRKRLSKIKNLWQTRQFVRKNLKEVLKK